MILSAGIGWSNEENFNENVLSSRSSRVYKRFIPSRAVSTENIVLSGLRVQKMYQTRSNPIDNINSINQMTTIVLALLSGIIVSTWEFIALLRKG